MSLLAPQVRKHLSADALFRLVQSDFARLPDSRVGDTEIALADALMSAFAMFSLKAPSLLAFDKERAEGNLYTIYGIERVPCDTRMREILDPISPTWLRPAFTSVFRQLQRGKALEAMTWLDCRLSNNFSRLTYKFSRVFEPLKAENRPVPTHTDNSMIPKGL